LSAVFPRTVRASLAIAWLLLAGLGLAWLVPAQAQDLQPVPALNARVLDSTGTLDSATRQQLEARLGALEQAKGSQVVILMVPTTAPEDIASYANRVGNAWKIGRREVGDGVLVVVALNDRKVRIEVAKALEGAIPDLAAKQIIEQAITPRFRQGDYAGGLGAAVDQLAARIQGEPLPRLTPAPAPSSSSASGFDLWDLGIFLFVAVPVVSAVARGLFGRRLGALLTGAGVGAVALWITASLVIAALAALVALLLALFSHAAGGTRGRGLDHGSGGFGGGGWASSGGGDSGGGFSSGGGGDFGGGGASGDW
jgi:uncharacterized protein